MALINSYLISKFSIINWKVSPFRIVDYLFQGAGVERGIAATFLPGAIAKKLFLTKSVNMG